MPLCLQLINGRTMLIDGSDPANGVQQSRPSTSRSCTSIIWRPLSLLCNAEQIQIEAVLTFGLLGGPVTNDKPDCHGQSTVRVETNLPVSSACQCIKSFLFCPLCWFAFRNTTQLCCWKGWDVVEVYSNASISSCSADFLLLWHLFPRQTLMYVWLCSASCSCMLSAMCCSCLQLCNMS